MGGIVVQLSGDQEGRRTIKLQCDPDDIDIFSQQEEPLFVPPTRFASCSSFNDLRVRV